MQPLFVVHVSTLVNPLRSFTASLSTLTNGQKKWQTKLSSAGLIYHHFGHRVISQLLANSQSDDNTINIIYDKVSVNITPINSYIPYRGKHWRGKTLASDHNFAKVLFANFYSYACSHVRAVSSF